MFQIPRQSCFDLPKKVCKSVPKKRVRTFRYNLCQRCERGKKEVTTNLINVVMAFFYYFITLKTYLLMIIFNFINDQVVRKKPVKSCVKEPQEKCQTVYEEVCENYEEKCNSPVYEEKCENIQEEKCEPVTLTECKAEPIQVQITNT